MEVRALFGRFIWLGVNIDDVTMHPSRGSRINPTLKVCRHNWVAHASITPDNGHLLEEPGWITCVAWKKQREEEKRWKDTEDKGSTYWSPIKHDTHVIGPSWTLDINWQDSSKRVGNPKTSRKESDVAVTLARLLHVSKVGQSKENGKTKQATLISDFHAHGRKSSLCPIRLAWS